MNSWKLVVLGLTTALAATIACSSSNTGGGGSDCDTLKTCCPSAETSACVAVANAGIEADCTAEVAAQCGGKGSGTGTGSTGSGSGGGGAGGVSCNVSKSSYCFNYKNLPSASESAVKSSCTSAEMGTVSTECPSANLVGCCTQNATTGGYTTEECFYSGGTVPYTASIVMSSCSSGKFSTSP